MIDPAGDPATLARRMVDELMARREVVVTLDEVDRALAEADLEHDSGAELRRLRRYESALHRRLRWTIAQIQFQGPLGQPDPALAPTWKAEATPPSPPEPEHADEKAAREHDPGSPHPPFDLTPEEAPPAGQEANIPAILKGRKRKRLEKAEARRQARRRKAGRLWV